MSRMVQSAQSKNLLDVVQLPPEDISGLISPSERGISSVLAVGGESRPVFLSAISALETPATALIVHVYAVDCLEIADELKIPKFVYISSHAWHLALVIYSPILHEQVGGEFGDDQKEPFILPGCTPVGPEDLPDPLLVQTKTNYLEFIRIAMEIPKADGILVNTWEELQPTTLASLRDEKLLGSVVKAPNFPIGPVTAEGDVGISKSESIEWMDKQPKESVLYFGVSNDMSSYLPEGFMSRTQDRGLVVPQWAPQMEILSHPSCGGFFTHCGWNSTIECITNRLPMIAWPLYAEQRMNATMLAEELGIAVGSRTILTKGVVGREEIEMMIKKIFVDEEGLKLRGKAKDLKLSAEKAWSKCGSSYNALAQMVKQCRNLVLIEMVDCVSV
ncbi:hypothetical protein REPUB_Repub10bG0159800 [Reevesia pubescens]